MKKNCDLLYYNFHEDRKLHKGFDSTIKILNLSKNKMGKEGVKVVADFVKAYGRVEALDMSFT